MGEQLARNGQQSSTRRFCGVRWGPSFAWACCQPFSAVHYLETKIPAPVVAATAGVSMKLYAKSFDIGIDPSALRMHVGLGLTQASALIVLAAVASMWRARTTINPLDPTKATRLVTSGLFQVSRNPMYVSLLVLLSGYAVRLDSVAVWLGPLFYVVYVTRFQIVPEERVLLSKFGEAYQRYKARTRRWL